jgi:hypothetical protein
MLNQPDLTPCPMCGVPIQVEIFPALFRPTSRGRGGETLMIDGESSCFYHPQKKAVVPCHNCGRFLCALCDCELHGEHFCPVCLAVARQEGGITAVENQRTLHDAVALSLAIFPLLIFYFTIITAPVTLYIAIRHWNSPRSIVRRTRIRLIVAIVLAALQIAGWGVGIYFLIAWLKSNG